MKKNFVLDTNVILHDYKCLNNFEENDIYLPIIVLEELDHFKKGNEQLNFNARQFSRELDDLVDDTLFSKGASLGEGRGNLFVLAKSVFPKELQETFMEKTSDHMILGATLQLAQEHPETKTILVTKDINLRIKARALGILAEDYITDKVTNMDVFDQGEVVFDDVSPELIDKLYASHEGVDIDEFSFKFDVEPNDCFVLKSSRSSALARYIPSEEKVKRVEKLRAFGIEPRNAEQAFAMEILLDDRIQLVALTGRSGTGKTLLALAAALHKHEEYKQILLARPIVALGNKDLGALPGDAQEKVAPYMQPLFDNLNVIKNNFSYQGKEMAILDELQKNKRLVIEALAFIRGRSLSETYFIIDEAQNLTPHEIKTIITRAGEGTKIIFTGDIYQIDSPYLDMQSNGLVYMIDRMKGQDLFAHVNLIKGERSQLSELASNLL
ncbi:MAG TPA: PhoH family protein [Paludibacteraceae bacterium]|nr:PhoH family protein [Paludibacteraceae bacterium]HQB69689.1 PhoH family protein [Paludibacteraceae bacterium]HRS67984.1 PhoH family protein [Paludibacteraceae bacterium]